jgi:hypothetical protein
VRVACPSKNSYLATPEASAVGRPKASMRDGAYATRERGFERFELTCAAT